jgi:endoglucanase
MAITRFIHAAKSGGRFAMKIRISGFAISMVILFGLIAVAQTPSLEQTGAWWQVQAPGAAPFRLNAKKLPLISVKGNKFIDLDGNPLLFRGLSLSDPDRLASQGHRNK